MDIYPPAVQRPALLRLASALGSRSAALRRDACGDWYILGNRGHIYAVPEGFQLVASTGGIEPRGSARQWAADKRHLGFCRLTQDGEDEGVFHLDRLPTPEEAEPIRRVLGIKKRKAISPEHAERLREQMRQVRLAA